MTLQTDDARLAADIRAAAARLADAINAAAPHGVRATITVEVRELDLRSMDAPGGAQIVERHTVIDVELWREI